MLSDESPLFSKSSDFIDWLLSVTNHFPRSQRLVITKRLLDAALDFQEHLLEAVHSSLRRRPSKLDQADCELDKVRFYLRMAARKQWLNEGQYEHAARMVSELGRLLGGWKKGNQRSDTAF